MNFREADDVNVETDENHEGRAVVNVVLGQYTTSLRVFDGELLRLRDAINARVGTPPADDVREALTRVLFDELTDDASVMADAILAAFEVRPHGTVTDAEARFVRAFIAQEGYLVPPHVVRAAFEAAQKERTRGD